MSTARFNGGDEVPAELAGLMDRTLDIFPTGQIAGLLKEGTPSCAWMMTPFEHATEQPTYSVHWVNDGRLSLKTNFDLLDALVNQHPHATFLAFCRRPALLRLLAARNWYLRSHESEPFMALMVYRSPNVHQIKSQMRSKGN